MRLQKEIDFEFEYKTYQTRISKVNQCNILVCSTYYVLCSYVILSKEPHKMEKIKSKVMVTT